MSALNAKAKQIIDYNFGYNPTWDLIKMPSLRDSLKINYPVLIRWRSYGTQKSGKDNFLSWNLVRSYIRRTTLITITWAAAPEERHLIRSKTKIFQAPEERHLIKYELIYDRVDCNMLNKIHGDTPARQKIKEPKQIETISTHHNLRLNVYSYTCTPLISN